MTTHNASIQWAHVCVFLAVESRALLVGDDDDADADGDDDDDDEYLNLELKEPRVGSQVKGAMREMI